MTALAYIARWSTAPFAFVEARLRDANLTQAVLAGADVSVVVVSRGPRCDARRRRRQRPVYSR
jgi:hypothetical protein